MSANFTLRTLASELQFLPLGANPPTPLLPSSFACELSLPVGATLGDDVVATVDLAPSVDPCAAIDDETAVIENAVAGVEEFNANVAFDWALGYRVLVVTATMPIQAYAGGPDYVLTINHLNLPQTGHHCGEVRISISSGEQPWEQVYSYLDIESNPETDNQPNPVESSYIGELIEYNTHVRFHVDYGVLTLV